MALSLDDILGFEYDWLATDAAGRVALFSTAGGGYAPAAMLRDVESHDRAIAAMLGTAPSTTARFAPQVAAGLTNTWLLAAERGLYAFDSDPNGGPYRLVAAPTDPASVDALPAEAATAAKGVSLRTINFEDRTEISNELLRQLC